MTKKAYEKPKVNKVELKPSEAVLTACKGRRIAGPGWRNCNPPGPGSCMTRTRT